MSSIDKDPKSKISKSSDKKFFLGFSDGFPVSKLPMIAALVSQVIRRNNGR